MAYRFAYSTNAYTRFPLMEALEDIHRRGFDGVEILADVPHAFAPHLMPEDRARLKAKLSERDLPVVNVNANTNAGLDPHGRDPHGFWPSLLETDSAARRQRVDYLLKTLDLAKDLDAPSIAVASGRCPEGQTPSEALDRLTEGLRPILTYAERLGIRVGIEYEPGFLIDDLDSTLCLLDRLPHPLLGVNLDIGHSACNGETLPHVIRALSGRIWNIHVEDIRGRIHEHRIPGTGDIDFSSLKTALDDTGYAGYLTLELYPYKEAPGEAGTRGLNYLKQVFRG